MNFKITGRDIKFFIIGIFAMLVFIVIYDWDDFKQGFNDGYNGYDKKEQVSQE